MDEKLVLARAAHNEDDDKERDNGEDKGEHTADDDEEDDDDDDVDDDKELKDSFNDNVQLMSELVIWLKSFSILTEVNCSKLLFEWTELLKWADAIADVLVVIVLGDVKKNKSSKIEQLVSASCSSSLRQLGDAELLLIVEFELLFIKLLILL